MATCMQLTIQIAELFLETPGGFLSIHQVSKRLGIPYGTAYNRIHEMGRLGFIHITPQGKAKLCTLNPDNPMTASLLGLGASQVTRRFLSSQTQAAQISENIRKLIESRVGDFIHSAILLNFDSFSSLKPAFSPSGSSGAPPDEPNFSLDLFLVMHEEGFSDPQLEIGIQAVFPPQFHPCISYMNVTPSTLLGMLRERENEAGLAAYYMLRRGLILQGFERFFCLLLQAFPPKLP